MENDKLIKLIDKQIGLKIPTFSDRKLTDTPTDALAVVPRKYVTRSSTTANRPTTSILGEFYFDTTAGLPVWWNGTNYQDAAGNVI